MRNEDRLVISIASPRYFEVVRRLIDLQELPVSVKLGQNTYNPIQTAKFLKDCNNEKLLEAKNLTLFSDGKAILGYHDNPKEMWASLSQLPAVEQLHQEGLLGFHILPSRFFSVSKKQWYLLSLLLPLVLPFLIWAICAIILPFAVGLPFPLSIPFILLDFIFLILITSLAVAGIPYVLFAIAIVWRSKGESAESVRHEARILPFVFASFLLVAIPLQAKIEIGYMGSFSQTLFFAIVAIPIGSAYVEIAKWLASLLSYAGRLHD